MSEPLKLVTKPPLSAEIAQASVELLSEALADARAGKVVEVIIITKESDGSWFHRASGSLSLREEIGGLQILIHDRIAQSEKVE